MAERQVSLAARAFKRLPVAPLATLVAALLLPACGQKGPLTLPRTPAAEAASAPAASAPR
jgi:predicted small lipoprotein YifL